MKLIAEIVAKVESLNLEGESRKMFHLKMMVEGESLESQGQGIMAAVKVADDIFASYNIGDEILFEEVSNG